MKPARRRNRGEIEKEAAAQAEFYAPRCQRQGCGHKYSDHAEDTGICKYPNCVCHDFEELKNFLRDGYDF